MELAEALGAPVIENGSRMNFPDTHDLDCTFMRQMLVRDADVILLLEVADPWGTLDSCADLARPIGQSSSGPGLIVMMQAVP